MAGDQVYANVSGLREIRRDLISADKRYGPELRKVLKETAEIVASDARMDIPVLTGKAKKSLKAGTSGAASVIRGGQNRPLLRMARLRWNNPTKRHANHTSSPRTRTLHLPCHQTKTTRRSEISTKRDRRSHTKRSKINGYKSGIGCRIRGRKNSYYCATKIF